MTVIDTSIASTATAYPNQRKIARCQNGVLWAAHNPSNATSNVVAELWYSTDNGTTWTDSASNVTQSSTTSAHVKNFSFFIDFDDFAHIVYKDGSNGIVYHRRGTPNTARTAWTWSNAMSAGESGSTAFNYPDVVAFRLGATTASGWGLFIIASFNDGTNRATQVWWYTIAAGGATSFVSTNIWTAGLDTFPSIDFHHTGNGKTVAGGTPHVYAAWSYGATGASGGIRFSKATFSGGSWTWGTERQITPDHIVTAASSWMNCMFDGTRVLIGGRFNSSVVDSGVILFERDVADTTTTSRNLIVGPGTAWLSTGSMSYDTNGDVHFFGHHFDSASGNNMLTRRKWTRATTTLGPSITVDSSTGTPYPSVKRGHSKSRVEFIYTDGTASPYSITYGSVIINPPPTSPVVVDTSASSAATAYSNQRKIDRCQNGVLWSAYVVYHGTSNKTTNIIKLAYSIDNGATWTTGGGGSIVANGSGSDANSHIPNASFFIDVDDYAHLVFKDNSNGRTYYRRGIPNATRTSWTWGGPAELDAASTVDYPEVVACRTPGSSPTEWDVFVVASYVNSGVSGRNGAVYQRLHVNSSDGVSKVGADGLSLGFNLTSFGVLGGYDNSNHKWTSIDFNHTGDGKTIAGGTPHLYAAWSSGALGTDRGIRFKKASYSAGAWTWGTEREINTTLYIDQAARWLNCLFDGSRVLIGGYLFDGTNGEVALWEKDAADVSGATTLAYIPDALGDRQSNHGSLTYDAQGNVYLVSKINSAPTTYGYRKWTRSTGVLSNSQAIATVDDLSLPYVSTKRGYSDVGVDVVYAEGTASPYSIKYKWIDTDFTPPAFPSIVDTSTGATATAYSNQRKIDRCQNGVLWTCFWNGTNTTTASIEFWYSTNDGATWNEGTHFGFGNTGTSYVPNISFFIDLDDYAHVVYKDRGLGYMVYRRGTPNAGRTAWTWSNVLNITTNQSISYPDIVACRNSVTGGWDAFMVESYVSGTTNYAAYSRIPIAANGTIGTPSRDGLSSLTGSDGILGGSYVASTHTFPSIDFNHTGDGKTVAGGTPHLYATWSAGINGAGKGIRFKKATYSGGAWTWGTEREIDPTAYVSNEVRWINCLFDGTAVIIAGFLFTSSVNVTRIWERDSTDTTTALLIDPGNTGMNYGGSTYDIHRNIHMIGYNNGNLRHDLWYRASNTRQGVEVLYAINSTTPHLSLKRGTSYNKLEFSYTDSASSPYSIRYNFLILNLPPNVPTNLSPNPMTVINPTQSNTFSWVHSDPDGDPQVAFLLARKRLM